MEPINLATSKSNIDLFKIDPSKKYGSISVDEQNITDPYITIDNIVVVRIRSNEGQSCVGVCHYISVGSKEKQKNVFRIESQDLKSPYHLSYITFMTI